MQNVLWDTCGEPGLTWSDLWKNRRVKQQKKVEQLTSSSQT